MELYLHAVINYVFMKRNFNTGQILLKLCTLHMEHYSRNSFSDACKDPS